MLNASDSVGNFSSSETSSWNKNNYIIIVKTNVESLLWTRHYFKLFKLVKISQHYEADKLLSPSEDKESEEQREAVTAQTHKVESVADLGF